ncbi:hypothetical protein ILUMI_01037 [Ignelater luminosus]|uniref:Reverse transcriptase n=1 Tax=Ignelater luminosus TaxID=2038154 RepID=A0A8K0GM27_IGNLU|nr:hypothetical protein ILUMI_01037 [Ignelater luminosus]
MKISFTSGGAKTTTSRTYHQSNFDLTSKLVANPVYTYGKKMQGGWPGDNVIFKRHRRDTSSLPDFDVNVLNKDRMLAATTLKMSLEKVPNLFNQLDIGKGAGPDGIPAVLLRNCAEHLALPISIIFNRSLKEGVFPKSGEKAYIVPIFKPGDKELVKNDRPVSLLSTLVYEIVLSTTKNHICTQQHGFLPDQQRGRDAQTHSEAPTEKNQKSKE